MRKTQIHKHISFEYSAQPKSHKLNITVSLTRKNVWAKKRLIDMKKSLSLTQNRSKKLICKNI